MKITSVTGHMMGLEFDAKYRSWQGVNPEQLFTAEVSDIAVVADRLTVCLLYCRKQWSLLDI